LPARPKSKLLFQYCFPDFPAAGESHLPGFGNPAAAVLLADFHYFSCYFLAAAAAKD